jgi:hypothetical protein
MTDLGHRGAVPHLEIRPTTQSDDRISTDIIPQEHFIEYFHCVCQISQEPIYDISVTAVVFLVRDCRKALSHSLHNPARKTKAVIRYYREASSRSSKGQLHDNISSMETT